MNITRVLIAGAMALSIGCCCLLKPAQAVAADSNLAMPAAIQAGFDSWSKGGGFDGAMYIWQKGGIMEGDRRAAELAGQLRNFNQAAGNFKSHEILRTDRIGKSSQVLYLSLNFERGAVYARFLLYRTDKNWVVQDMDFNTRPETIMPWLALAAEKSTE
jgi:hypothetical protein